LPVAELGRLSESSYFNYDKNRYLNMIDMFRGGWHYYLSVLETDIIEMKLKLILESLTFRYTRRPQDLCLTPERLNGRDLRISAKIKILNPKAFTKDGKVANNDEKFFMGLQDDLIDPNREAEKSKRVNSILATVNNVNLRKKVDKKLTKQGKSLNEAVDEKKDFSVFKDFAIAGF
jgi:hypothetical protein